MRITRRGQVVAWILLVLVAVGLGLWWPYVWIGG